ncbi:MAG: hypothetical protein REI64_16190 [Pedobacter sp.]|uniref:hypothetical protein n=1 Tax=Pedobacter sp. TaxID=1411316 RepID=UPI002809B3B5|nr:hypothetical protein [Pedobacter sp.]MDQ8006343.1 hypothetical protein [Pedobacter sp.]
MFNSDSSKQKSPQQRFLLILGVAMIILFCTLAVVVAFFGDLINLDPLKFPQEYRVAFAVVLMIYAAIRFFRILRDNR